MAKYIPCPDCGGTGEFNREEGFVDGLYYPAIENAECESCGGSGLVESIPPVRAPGNEIPND